MKSYYKHRHLSIVFKFSLLLVFGVLLLCQIKPVKAQAPQFTQFYATPLYLAPSFTGDTRGSRIAMNYRSQWPEFSRAFVSYAFSFDHYFHDYNSGAGILFLRDQSGSTNLATTNVGALYSYNFNLDRKWIMRPGIHLLYSQRSIDRDKLIFGDQLSLEEKGVLGQSQTTLEDDEISYFDASASLIAYRKSLWMGVTFDHVMTPNQSMTQQESHIPLKTSFYGGYRFGISSPFAGVTPESISLTFLYKNQGSSNQLDLGSYWIKEPISIGLQYRGIPIFNNPTNSIFNNDAISIMVAFVTSEIRVGYSYDFTISNLLGSTGGSHEVSLIYEFNQSTIRGDGIPCIDCPFDPY